MICQSYGLAGETGAELLFHATQRAVEELTGSRRYPQLTWSCPGCGQQVNDRAAAGLPVHAELATRRASTGSPATRPPTTNAAATNSLA